MSDNVPEKTPPIVDSGSLIEPILKGIKFEYFRTNIQVTARIVKSNNLRFFLDKCDI